MDKCDIKNIIVSIIMDETNQVHPFSRNEHLERMTKMSIRSSSYL